MASLVLFFKTGCDNMRSCLYVITRDNSATMRAIMALALAHMKTFSSLLEVTQTGARGVCRFGYSAASVFMCIGCASLCHWKGASISARTGNLTALTC